MNTARKIKSWAEAAVERQLWAEEGKKVVFTNGCFDIVHMGHVEYLEASRNKGDVLIVGINADSSIRGLKGPERPVVPEGPRCRLIAALECVSMVVLFDEQTPLSLIMALRPDILTKGADYTVENIVGADFVLANGGAVETIDLVPGFSTTLLISRLREGLSS